MRTLAVRKSRWHSRRQAGHACGREDTSHLSSVCDRHRVRTSLEMLPHHSITADEASAGWNRKRWEVGVVL